MSDINSQLAERKVPIEWHFPEGVSAKYATNITVQRTEHEYIVSFFEIYPPLIVGDSPADVAKQVENIKSVAAECIARIIIAADRFPEFLSVLQANLSIAPHMKHSEGDQ